MRLLSSLIWLFVAGTTVPICSATMASGRSFAVHHVKSQKVLLESIPRGGAISFNPKLIDLKSFDLTSIDPKTVATVGLSCLAVHCAFDVLAPKTMVEFYGLDKYEKINSFYLSRIGGWGMVVATTLLLQLYSTIPSMKTIGYAFLPIAFITMFQLLTGKYDEAGVNPNSGIAAVFFHDIHFVVCFLATKLPPIVAQVWVPFYMALIGLSGLNLVISAQTVPGISKSTIAILRILGTVSCYLASTILSEDPYFGFSPLKAVGVGLVTLAITSIPVCFDLNGATRPSSRTAQWYTVSVILELIAAFYLLR